MEPQFATRPAFTVVGLKYRGKNEEGEIPRLWGKLMERFDEIKGGVKASNSYGVTGNFDQERGVFDYLAGFEIRSGSESPEGMETWRLPEQTYAIFPTTLPSLMETFDKITNVWLPESGYRRAEGPEFEFYDESFDPQDENSRLYLYIPVVRET
jgi:AraC family transcriptional regulator